VNPPPTPPSSDLEYIVDSNFELDTESDSESNTESASDSGSESDSELESVPATPWPSSTPSSAVDPT